MKTYREYRIVFSPFNVDLISGLLWQLKIEGITELDNSLLVYSSSENLITESDFENILQKARKENLVESFLISSADIENINWNEEWEKKIQIIEVTPKIVIKPSFRNYQPKEGQIVITIDPKMSFGTGEHETTKLMIQLIEKHFTKNSKILDIGSGTAVLSIEAAKLGAAEVFAIDNDELCLENGLENIKINKVDSQIHVLNCELKDLHEYDFDFIVANINKHILIDIASDIRQRIKSNGILILSGLLISDEIDIINHYQQIGFKVTDKKSLNEWMALILRPYNFAIPE
ncbi:MAG: 50S ribosomal protein L11 methyltransferase [Ignavibacteriales bacterium]